MQARHGGARRRGEGSVRLVAGTVALTSLVFVAAACGKHEAGRTAMSCDEAARRAVDALVKRTRDRLASAKLPDDVRANMEERAAKLDAMAPRLRAVIENHCTDDRWPPTVIECHAKITSMDELRACRAHLSADQQARVQRDELELLAGAQGLPGFGAAPPPASPEVARFEQAVRRINSELADAQREVEDARSDAERDLARAEVRQLQKQLEAANAALTQARASSRPALPSP